MTGQAPPTRGIPMTRDWLVRRLLSVGLIPRSAELVDLRAVPLRQGRLASTQRLHMEWAGPAAHEWPTTLIAKLTATDERSRATGLDSGAYAREIAFYIELADLLPISTPRAHLAVDEGEGQFVLLLEDVLDAPPGDQVAGLSLDQAATAVTTLARLHAAAWGRPARSDLLRPRCHDGGRRMAAIYRLMAPRFLEAYGDVLDADTIDVFEAFIDVCRRWIPADREPFTLLHGDYRADNLLFGAHRLTVVDWQTAAYGPGPSDLAYLLGGSIEVARRRSAEESLVGLYRSRLAAEGVEVPARTCWMDYARNAVAGVHMTAIGAMLVEADDAARQMFCAMAQRHAAHARDLDALRLLDRSA